MLAAVIAGLLILVGLIGTVVPVLPGLFLVWAAAVGWGLFWHTPIAWAVVALSTVVLIGGLVLRIVIPGRRLKNAEVPGITIAAGMAAALVGFFVIPIVGLVVGLVLGIYGAEAIRLRDLRAARPATVVALKLVGLGIVLEAGTAGAIAGLWLVGVVAQALT